MATMLLLLSLLSSSALAFAPVPMRSFVGRKQWLQAVLDVDMMTDVFEDEDEAEELVPVVEHYLRAKYQNAAAESGHLTISEATDILKTLLPPVTPEELESEIKATLGTLVDSKDGKEISEDGFVTAMAQNTYWKEAGGLVVKELMYLDALYSYYSRKSGSSKDTVALLNDDDFNELKDSLTWEGSSVATMSANEAKFVTAVAASRRGQTLLSDEEYGQLKTQLKEEQSWVTARSQDSLEKLGLQTFMGYLHRAL